uniref:Uncharacterized protein n=1 Tax=Arion vulgaris TaxID=1028688 RepID=A0A0B6YF56_9EUPU
MVAFHTLSPEEGQLTPGYAVYHEDTSAGTKSVSDWELVLYKERPEAVEWVGSL